MVVVSIEHQNERDGRKEEEENGGGEEGKGEGTRVCPGSIWEA
jgi:hypothetical protein